LLPAKDIINIPENKMSRWLDGNIEMCPGIEEQQIEGDVKVDSIQ
jgi:hypothetical protein